MLTSSAVSNVNKKKKSERFAPVLEDGYTGGVAGGSSHWATVLRYLSGIFPSDIMETWFNNLHCLEESPNGVILSVPSDFAALWIEQNYLDLIKKQYAQLFGQGVSVKLTTLDEKTAVAPAASPSAPASFLPLERSMGAADARSRLPVPPLGAASQKPRIQINPRYTFENFIVGGANQLAHAAAVAVAQSPARAYNPLFLYGDSGLGKTHLLQAIAHSVLDHTPSANVMYLSCEKFANDFIHAIETHSLPKFRKHYRQADILLIDDIQFLADKDRTQEEFFHTFNELFEGNKQICLTSDRPAGEISKLEARLVSRFQWGMVTDIQVPDFETRVAIMRRKAGLLGISISDEIISFLARAITRNVRRMEGALTRVSSYANLMNGVLDLPKVEHLLKDILQEEAQAQLTIEKIQQKVIEYYKLRPSDMQSKRRPSGIAFPRQVAMYLCRLLTSHALQEIGEHFGGRDHGTVIHACKAVENMMEQDMNIKRTVELLQAQLSRHA